MITWLPTPSFKTSAKLLSDSHLRQQRADVFGILVALFLYPEDGVSPIDGRMLPGVGHPAIEQWRGYELALMNYGVACCEQFASRGHEDHLRQRMFGFIGRIMERHNLDFDDLDFPEDPPWLCMPRLHSSHRAALLLKDPTWYGQYKWTEEPSSELWWPTEARDLFLKKIHKSATIAENPRNNTVVVA
jgi:hypothetical protein